LKRIEGVHAIGYAVQLRQQRRHPSGHRRSLGLAGEVIDGAFDDGGLTVACTKRISILILIHRRQLQSRAQQAGATLVEHRLRSQN